MKGKIADRRVAVEQLLGGAALQRIESFATTATGGLTMMIELTGGRMACLEFRVGEPIVARVVA